MSQLQTKKMLLLLIACISTLFLSSCSLENSVASSLEKTGDWEVVQSTCTECHSSQLISQNSGTREVWLSRIRWMQDTQGLKELDSSLEDTILGYLTLNYGPKTASRRPSLTEAFLPTNPYSTND
ncbi:MAG: hypothetical protein HOF74_12360 [Gammaproteobacteria bacterium]|nr:hypothetical protein [Gammaproteobacteria bacterium]MBT3860619.1 hypothetical protein [Gammaproteobacteria bacterium]MBT3988756.1 hypothetical protein [Gammaproteobacteria bacterium]MBT4255610.1 hypothetical protein [Gammaproteobacteria bacterium]MBT4582619.1 hypothetical protein [Gammaproteobacteria bacterium]